MYEKKRTNGHTKVCSIKNFANYEIHSAVFIRDMSISFSFEFRSKGDDSVEQHEFKTSF